MKNLSFLFIISISFICFTQNTLKVECLNSQNANSSYFSLDSNVIEYGVCSSVASFYVAIIDSSCNFWETQFFQSDSTGHNLGNFNNNGACRNRKERYFIFRQNNSNELKKLDSLLSYELSTNQTVLIYTPFSYSYSIVQQTCPELAQTLNNYWGNNVIIENSMIVLFGTVGYPSSYLMDNNVINGKIIFETQVCPSIGQSASLFNQQNSSDFNFYPNPTNDSFTIEFNHSSNGKIEILDLKGITLMHIEYKASRIIVDISKLNSGTYILCNDQGAKKIFVKK